MTARHVFIVTPVLNGEKFLAASLASIDSQTFPAWTHFVVDGGSSDGTVELVRKSMEKEPRRRLIQGRDRGLYDAVFKGFDAAEAESDARDDDIFLWLNADDLLAPWAFATMQAALDMHRADWATGQPGRWDEEGRLVLVYPTGHYGRWFISHGWFSMGFLGSIQQESTFFTRRLLRTLPAETIEKIRSLRLAGDFLLWREFSRFSPLRVLPTLVGGFRMHSGNLSSTSLDGYMKELRANGAVLPPKFVARSLNFAYRTVSAVIASWNARRPVIAAQEHSGRAT